MKKRIWALIMIAMLTLMMAVLPGCGKADAEADAKGTETEQTGQTEDSQPAVEIVKTIDGIDSEEEEGAPLQISSIILFADGSVKIIPVDDLRKNEIKNDDADGIFPFEESGPVKDVKVLYFGNNGYRTIVALMKDGTISAVNPSALINDHIIAVMDNVAGRDNFVSVENEFGEDEINIVAVTEDKDEVILDYSMNFES
jgi:hypothetical protein